MELLQLHYFKTIAECQHITKAANKLMISQPSLSNTLSRIEHELGVQLFDRQGRNIILNNYGKIVLEHANNILRELDNIRTEIDDLEQRHDKVITIASTDSIYVKEWLPVFIERNSDLAIRHSVSTGKKIETELLNGNVDFGISQILPESPDFNYLELWQDQHVVLLPIGHPLADKTHRPFSDFASEPFVALPKSENVSRSIDTLSQASGFKPNIIFEGERELIERVFLPLNGLLLMLKSVIRTEVDRELCSQYCNIVELDDPEAHISIKLFWDKRRYLSTSAQRLIEYIQNSPVNPWHLSSPSASKSTDFKNKIVK